MAQPEFIVTDAGLAAASIATPTGPYINIVKFKIGSSFNYTPTSAATALVGTTLVDAAPISYTSLDANTINIKCLLDETMGPFTYGEVGLYLPGDILFAIAVYPTQQSQSPAAISGYASRRFINAVIRLKQATAIINVTTQNGMNLLELSGWSALPPPSLMVGGINAAIIHEESPCGDSPVVTRDSATQWTIHKYVKNSSGALTASTVNTITSAALLVGGLDGTTTKRYLVQDSLGNIRSISSINTGTGVATLTAPTAVAMTGTVTLYECDCLFGAQRFIAVCGSREYNYMANLYNPIWSTPNGLLPPANSGWGENAVPIISLSAKPSTAQWSYLMTSIVNGATHSGLTTAVLATEDFQVDTSNPATAIAFKFQAYLDTVALISSINATRSLPSIPTLNISAPGSGQRIRTALPWINRNHVIDVTFGSNALQLAYFNSGGTIMFSGSLATPTNYEDSQMAVMLAAIGTIAMNYDTTTCIPYPTAGTLIGFYDLTNSFQIIASAQIAGPSGGFVKYKVEGRTNGTSALQFKITFFDTLGVGPYYATPTTAVLTSNVSMRRASSTLLTAPIVAYPTLVSSGTL